MARHTDPIVKRRLGTLYLRTLEDFLDAKRGAYGWLDVADQESLDDDIAHICERMRECGIGDLAQRAVRRFHEAAPDLEHYKGRPGDVPAFRNASLQYYGAAHCSWAAVLLEFRSDWYSHLSRADRVKLDKDIDRAVSRARRLGYGPEIVSRVREALRVQRSLAVRTNC